MSLLLVIVGLRVPYPFVDPVLLWAPFFYSFGPGLFIIRVVADWWKVRLYFPLNPPQPTLGLSTLRRKAMATPELRDRYEAMSYESLRKELIDFRVNPAVYKNGRIVDRELVEYVYAGKALKKYHIHHFIFGIPGMFLSWIFFVYGRGWIGLFTAGITAALFLSELRELVTQDWQR